MFQVYDAAVIFGQVFPATVEGANSSSKDNIASSFPSFMLQNASFPRGYVSFQGCPAKKKERKKEKKKKRISPLKATL